MARFFSLPMSVTAKFINEKALLSSLPKKTFNIFTHISHLSHLLFFSLSFILFVPHQTRILFFWTIFLALLKSFFMQTHLFSDDSFCYFFFWLCAVWCREIAFNSIHERAWKRLVRFGHSRKTFVILRWKDTRVPFNWHTTFQHSLASSTGSTVLVGKYKVASGISLRLYIFVPGGFYFSKGIFVPENGLGRVFLRFKVLRMRNNVKLIKIMKRFLGLDGFFFR